MRSLCLLLFVLVGFGVEQRPLVINQTTGKQEQLQSSNSLSAGVLATGSTSIITLQNRFGVVANVADFGAVPDDVTDDTAAIAAAIASLPLGGGTVVFNRGTFITDSIILPDYPKIVYIVGQGKGLTILQALSMNKPVIKGAATVTPAYATSRNQIRGLGIKAHASGSTGEGVDCRNISYTDFCDIQFYKNGSGLWTNGFLLQADGTYHCYNNSFSGVWGYIDTAISDNVFLFVGNPNQHNISRTSFVGVSTKCMIKFPTGGTVSNVNIDTVFCEGWSGTTPSVIDIGTGNSNIYVSNSYFEDVIKTFDETKTSSCIIDNTYFAASPGTSQSTALGANYRRKSNPSGGTNVNDAVVGPQYFYSDGTTSGFRLYDAANTGFATLSFNGTFLAFNYPIVQADNITISTAGKGIAIKEGANAKMGAAALVGGTVTVNTTAVTANSRIYLTSQVDGGTPGFQRISARSAGTSFTITSSNVLDTSTVAWMIVEPAP